MNEIDTMPEVQLNSFCRWLAKATEQYLEIPENKQRFEAWLKEKRERQKAEQQAANPEDDERK